MNPWPTLLERALRHLAGQKIDRSDWSWGGGTVLMLRYGHRQSRDIDLFLHDVQHLSYLSPRLNDDTARGITHYDQSANHLRLAYPEGEIDFLVVAPVFPHIGSEIVQLDGFDGSFHLMPDVEILGQKLHYRAFGFTGRDLYDFAAVTSARPELLLDTGLVAIAQERADALTMSVDSAGCRAGYQKLDEPTLDITFEEARDTLLEWIARGPAPSPSSIISPGF